MAEAAQPLVIAVDGPAAAGKGTLARRLAAHLGLRHLESGLLYRAVAARLLRAGGDPEDAGAAARTARMLAGRDLEASGLRDERVGRAASVVSRHPDVRAALIGRQRAFGASAPGAVIDGRDIGTVVFPGAAHKLFVTADIETRIGRRVRELAGRGEPVDREQVAREMAERDARDSARDVAPLRPAPDAVIIDTTHMDPDAAFEAALAVLGPVAAGTAGTDGNGA